MSMCVRKLTEQNLTIAKSFDGWIENNDPRLVISLINNKIMDVFAVMDGDKPVGVFNVSYKVTALGMDIVNNCVHINSLFTNDEAVYMDVVRTAIRSIRSCVPDRYNKIVVSINEDDEELVFVVKGEGISTVIGNITFMNGTNTERRVILMGMKNGGSIS